jgi:hypothetical protein
MADCFLGVPIQSHDLQRQNLTWLRGRYGQSPQFADRGWTLLRVWEQSATMTCGIRFYDKDGKPLVGYPVTIGWFDHTQGAVTQLKEVVENDVLVEFGWVDVPIDGGQYNASSGQVGGMFIKAVDGSFAYTGIGWPYRTNHDHLNLDIRQGTSSQLPVEPPPETAEGVTLSSPVLVRPITVHPNAAPYIRLALADLERSMKKEQS